MPSKVADHLANERTFLAWIRTALGLIGLGFVLARMGLFLRQLAVTTAHLPGGVVPRHRGEHEFLLSGVVLALLGTMVAGGSAWIYARNRRAIEADAFTPAWGAVLGLTVVAVLGGVVIVGLVLGSVWNEVPAGVP